MRYPRFRLRILLILVAVVAILLGRSVRFGNQARGHERERRSLFPGNLGVYLVMQAVQGEGMHPESETPLGRSMRPIRAFLAYHLRGGLSGAWGGCSSRASL